MKTIRIDDSTLCREQNAFSFKEKIEIARQLEKLSVDVIEIPAINDARADILFVKTISSFVKKGVLSVAAGLTEESIEQAASALSNAKHPCIRIELPVSAVGMEYTCHKKPDKMLVWVGNAVKLAKEKCGCVEFCAVDATRADKDFLRKIIEIAVENGASAVTICDSAAETMPDDFAEFIADIMTWVNVPVGVGCNNKNGLATAQAILSVRKGATTVRTSVDGENVSLDVFATMVKNCGQKYGVATKLSNTELYRIVKQIRWISDTADTERAAVTVTNVTTDSICLDEKDSQADVIAAVSNLGYDLSDDDQNKVYEEFLRVAAKKKVGLKELEAIVASAALQVPATYKLISYVINNGNIISASAQITLQKDGKTMQEVCIGAGPIDAAFLAIDKIIGCHYELDEFHIQSVTEGKEAMGSALVKLRSGGKLYSGNGISTDIIGASIRAYLNAVNKIVYEEA